MNFTNTNGRTGVTANPEAAIAAYKMSHGHEPQYIKLYPCIANETGIHEALIIQIVESWCLSNARQNKRGYFYDDNWWTSLTYSAWKKEYPYLGTEKSIQKRLLEMEKAGYIFSCQPRKKNGSSVKFYRINSVKVGVLVLNDSPVVTKSDEPFHTEPPIVTKSDGVVTFGDGVVTKSDVLPVWNPPPERVSGSLIDQGQIKVTNDLTQSVVDFEEKEAPDWNKVASSVEEIGQCQFSATSAEVPVKNPPVVGKISDWAQSAAAPSSENSNNETIIQNWECPNPKLRREFMGWLAETAKGIQTARHAVNWCNKNPQDADLTWDDFLKARKRSEAQFTSFANWEEERHQMMVQTYHSAVERAREGAGIFLENFKVHSSAWLGWATQNRPEWLKSPCSA